MTSGQKPLSRVVAYHVAGEQSANEFEKSTNLRAEIGGKLSFRFQSFIYVSYYAVWKHIPDVDGWMLI